MKLVARTLLAGMAAGALIVGPSAAAFAAGPDVAPPSAGQNSEPVQDVVDEVTGAAEKVLGTGGETGDETGDETGTDTGTSTSKTTAAAVPFQTPADKFCEALGGINPDLEQPCKDAFPAPGDSGDDNEPALDPIFNELPQQLYDAVHDLICQLDAALPEDIRIRTVYAEVADNPQFKPIADQIPTKIDEALRDPCDEPTTPPTTPPTDDDQPAPVRDATLPKTGGAPLWLIPMGLFLVALGSKLVWPAANGR